MGWPLRGCILFFFNDTATTEIYTLSLHDALPISYGPRLPRLPAEGGFLVLSPRCGQHADTRETEGAVRGGLEDRKSTRLNSSHSQISYAVFCLKKKKRLPVSTPRRHRPTARPPTH